jgi:hypothetical protein
MIFIFTCKASSHKYIAEQVKDAPFDEHKWTVWKHPYHYEHCCRWVNGIENRADPKFMHVNYLEYTIKRVETGKITYRNTWITNKPITENNVVEMAKVARSRWKIENEHNYTLKHHGYNLEHNCGHGKKHAAEIAVRGAN